MSICLVLTRMLKFKVTKSIPPPSWSHCAISPGVQESHPDLDPARTPRLQAPGSSAQEGGGSDEELRLRETQ